MKYLILFAFALTFIIPANAQESSKLNTTTYYLIRHAEKDRSDKSNRNPDLNDDGLKRAENWSRVFENIDFDAIYSTSYNRTIQTAQPTANAKGLDIQTYDPRQLYSEEFAKATQGKTVLIVGHSNTTPAFANAILNEQKYSDMDDFDNGSLFIITISEGNKIDQVLIIN